MGYRYEVEYTAWYEVVSDEKLTEDEAIELAIEQHEDLPDGSWSVELEQETADGY
jgi:hypothetical protein